MEPNIKKEVETLKLMARNWRRGYAANWIEVGSDNEYVYQEFTEEIITTVHPYVNRLLECQYISNAEATELLNYWHGQVDELKRETEEAERNTHKVYRFRKFLSGLFTSGKS